MWWAANPIYWFPSRLLCKTNTRKHRAWCMYFKRLMKILDSRKIYLDRTKKNILVHYLYAIYMLYIFIYIFIYVLYIFIYIYIYIYLYARRSLYFSVTALRKWESLFDGTDIVVSYSPAGRLYTVFLSVRLSFFSKCSKKRFREFKY